MNRLLKYSKYSKYYNLLEESTLLNNKNSFNFEKHNILNLLQIKSMLKSKSGAILLYNHRIIFIIHQSVTDRLHKIPITSNELLTETLVHKGLNEVGVKHANSENHSMIAIDELKQYNLYDEADVFNLSLSYDEKCIEYFRIVEHIGYDTEFSYKFVPELFSKAPLL